MVGPLKVGTPSPNFHLPATYARIMDLKDYKGRKNVVLIFCPEGDSNPEVTKYLCALRDRSSEIKGHEAEIIGVSPANQRIQSIFAYKYNLPFAFLIDESRECARTFHALKEDGRSIECTTYVIDRNGLLRFGEQGTPAVDRIVDVLRGLGSP